MTTMTPKYRVTVSGKMGVPITYLDKHCPEDYEILGMDKDLSDDKGRGCLNGCRTYARIIIRRKGCTE